MKVIIAGSRDINPMMIQVEGAMKAALYHWDITEVVSGGAAGVDLKGEMFAKIGALKLTQFPADWNKHGKAAGPIRNRQMAEYADALLLIWDGKSRGSASMLAEARKAGLRIVQIVIEDTA